MVLLEKLWDDVVAGPQPDRGLGKLRKLTTKPLTVKTGSIFINLLSFFWLLFICFLCDGFYGR